MFFFFLWPASFYWEGVENRKNEIEEKFPDFLRDLAEYWKGGLSMTVAVQTLATSEYGALNDEVKKMSDQLSGNKFSDVILQFAERANTSGQTCILLISEADRAGGKISDILVTAANDLVKSSSLKVNGNERLVPTLPLFDLILRFPRVMLFYRRSLFLQLPTRTRPMTVAEAKTLET